MALGREIQDTQSQDNFSGSTRAVAPKSGGKRGAFYQDSQARPGDIKAQKTGAKVDVLRDQTYQQANPWFTPMYNYAEDIAAQNRGSGGGVQTRQGIASSYASGQYRPDWSVPNYGPAWSAIAGGADGNSLYQKGTTITPVEGMPSGLGASGAGGFSDGAQQAQQVAGLNMATGVTPEQVNFSDGGQIGGAANFPGYIARGKRFPWEAGWATGGGSNKPEDQYSRGAASRRSANQYREPASAQGPDAFARDNPNNMGLADAERKAVRGYAEGGQIGAPPNDSGAGIEMPQQGPMNPQMADANIQDLLTRNPQVAQQIQQVVQEAMANGDLTPQMANMAVQLAQACIQNPALWPKLRQFAVQQGLAGPSDLPMQYDEGLVVTILIAARAAQGQGGMGGPQMGQAQQMGGPPGQGQPQAAAMQGDQGGMLQGPGTGTSDSIPAQNMATGGKVNLSNGEYIIPARVVAHKGREFFDNLVMKYNGRAPAA